MLDPRGQKRIDEGQEFLPQTFKRFHPGTEFPDGMFTYRRMGPDFLRCKNGRFRISELQKILL
jgi:hypothetical protein